MKRYYYIVDEVQHGPVSFNDLKKIKIVKQTMVWYEGMSDWSSAGDLEELRDLWVSMPPPIKKDPPVYKPILNESKVSFLQDNRSKVLLGSFLGVIVLVLFFSFSDRENTLLIQETKANSEMLNEQQKLIDEQNRKIAEQERIERERLEQQQREERQKKINELQFNLVEARKEREESVRHLNDVSAFKFLRSSSERNRQINEANEKIAFLDAKISEIESELSNLGVVY
ncbi:hypothetical protein FLJC2902T_12870 [Flavobacterium limnosediminis JC2902]|uniref:GYF domain-containing protein n=1 Tax=Flavobacterium limnosediminis JC2902 TaxID=1341181 RepID=V6SQ08_9FLAO|nr:DUF4339 domain-containing protein [Flavobacterium limnosediminis]ESU28696.1 hypothetical protein FLJC2902T_12870 [Flavobacterium limnosediminis JC2902]